MKKYIILSACFFFSAWIYSQGNCNLYEDKCKESCELAYEAKKRQGSRESQESFDKCIELCPSFAYAYFEKSVPYLKQGLYKEWKELMDKAVNYDPGFLLNRGCNQIQFIRNYKNGLGDLDSLVSLRKTIDIGFSPSGEYHAQMLRAISNQKLGNLVMAIELSEELVNSDNYYQGPFDYFHIGIFHLEAGNLDRAEKALMKQNEYDEKAESYFYLSRIFEQRGELLKQRVLLEKSKELYEGGRIMTNNYYHHIDKIFMSDIESEIEKLEN